MTESAVDGAGPCINCGRRQDEPHATTCRVAVAYVAGWEAAMRQQNVPEEQRVDPPMYQGGIAMNDVRVSHVSHPATLGGSWIRITVNGWITAYFRYNDDAQTYAEKVASEAGWETASPSIYSR